MTIPLAINSDVNESIRIALIEIRVLCCDIVQSFRVVRRRLRVMRPTIGSNLATEANILPNVFRWFT